MRIHEPDKNIDPQSQSRIGAASPPRQPSRSIPGTPVEQLVDRVVAAEVRLSWIMGGRQTAFPADAQSQKLYTPAGTRLFPKHLGPHRAALCQPQVPRRLLLTPIPPSASPTHLLLRTSGGPLYQQAPDRRTR